VFVKVGANDGITGDPCSDILLADPRWKGLLIEPVPYCFERLAANFADAERFSVEQVAIGTAVGETTFYYVHPNAHQAIPDLPNWFDQVGSFARNHIVKHLSTAVTPYIVECKVQVRPLADVLRKNGIRDFHLLHIDTEGHDYEVLKTLDFAAHAPVAIFVEHKHLADTEKRKMVRFLRKHGYSVRDCGCDYFALDKTANKRLNHSA
jgi:FkbM family methyltransferase